MRFEDVRSRQVYKSLRGVEYGTYDEADADSFLAKSVAVLAINEGTGEIDYSLIPNIDSICLIVDTWDVQTYKISDIFNNLAKKFPDQVVRVLGDVGNGYDSIGLAWTRPDTDTEIETDVDTDTEIEADTDAEIDTDTEIETDVE